MRAKVLFGLHLLCLFVLCGASGTGGSEVEPRGKKKKIALLLFIVDLVAKKIFFIKIFYAVVFFIILHKAGYLLSFFAKFLKKSDYDHIVPHDHFGHHDHYVPHHYQEYGPPSDSYGPYGPYRRGQ